MPPTVCSLQLSLYAFKLPNVAGAFHGVSDPFAVVTLLSSDRSNKPRVLGKTEVIKNSLNPRWTKVFYLEYELGKPQYLNIGIYDEVRKSNDKPMGSAQFEVGDILGARGNVKAKQLKKGGTLFARVEKAEASSDAGLLTLSLRGVGLKNVDRGLLRGKSDPFFEVQRRVDGPAGYSWSVAYRSKHVMNDLNPLWEPASIPLHLLCGGDYDRPIQILVWDWEKSGKHKPMGQIETSLSALLSAIMPDATGNAKTLDMSRAFKLTKNGKNYGSIVVINAVVNGSSHPSSPTASGQFMDAAPVPAFNPHASSTPRAIPGTPTGEPTPAFNPYASTSPQAAPVPYGTAPMARTSVYQASTPTFVDYVSGGCELQMCVAIDFTGSNGDPRRPGTLHHIRPDGSLNDYEKALTAVGSIVAKYDSDQKFPVYGFGAKYDGIIRHCFQVGQTPEVEGIGGILESYRGVFKTPITMSGPTLFHEVIDNAASQARQKQIEASRIGQQAYCILLILTDGAVSDVHGTKEAIAAASDAPLSIVIVGIGRADFSAMQFLDDFAGPGQKDICQFVEFEKHKDNKNSLTQATLEEIPSQLVDYFNRRGIQPLPMVRGSRINVLEEQYNEEEDIDLSLEFGQDGEITLGGDDTHLYVGTGSYGNFGQYTGMTVLPPPAQLK